MEPFDRRSKPSGRKPGKEALAGKPHVTIVAHQVGSLAGGMERQLQELISGLLDAGIRVTLVARRCEVPPHALLRLIRVRSPSRPFVIAYPWFFLVASCKLARYRDGIVHTTGAIVNNRVDISTVHFCHQALPKATAVARTRHATAWYRLNARVAAGMSRLAELWCYRPSRVGRLVAVSAGVQDEIERHFRDMVRRTTVIPNGVDVSEFRPDADSKARTRRALGLPDRALIALFVGGEWERKGLRFALEALRGTPRWHLLAVGDGDAGRYRAMAEAAGVAERVHLVEPTAEIAAFYQAADAFLLPTAYETFSLATYEAAASGLPLLVTHVSGVEDILVDGVNGWFIDQSAGSIAHRLSGLAAGESLRASMGAEARAASLRFQWRPMVESYAELYRLVDGAQQQEAAGSA